MAKSLMNLFIVFTFFLTTSSCREDDQSVKEILMSHAWKLSSYKWNNVEQFLDECVKDDCYTFHSDSTYTILNTIKCSDNEPDITYDQSMKWSVSEDGNTFYFHYGTDITRDYSIYLSPERMTLISDGGYIEKTYIPC
jgi:hypothetical protein